MFANSNAYGGQTGFINGSGRDYNNLESMPYVKATGTTKIQLIIANGVADVWIFQEKLYIMVPFMLFCDSVFTSPPPSSSMKISQLCEPWLLLCVN